MERGCAVEWCSVTGWMDGQIFGLCWPVTISSLDCSLVSCARNGMSRYVWGTVQAQNMGAEMQAHLQLQLLKQGDRTYPKNKAASGWKNILDMASCQMPLVSVCQLPQLPWGVWVRSEWELKMLLFFFEVGALRVLMCVCVIPTTDNATFENAVVAPRWTVKHNIGEESWKN